MMRAIRPIYDGKDDLEYRTEIDSVDMMACFFSEVKELIEAMDITESEKMKRQDLVDEELLKATDLNEIIITFEITRWLSENSYLWDAVVPYNYKYVAQALGIAPVNFNDSKECWGWKTL